MGVTAGLAKLAAVPALVLALGFINANYVVRARHTSWVKSLTTLGQGNCAIATNTLHNFISLPLHVVFLKLHGCNLNTPH